MQTQFVTWNLFKWNSAKMGKQANLQSEWEKAHGAGSSVVWKYRIRSCARVNLQQCSGSHCHLNK